MHNAFSKRTKKLSNSALNLCNTAFSIWYVRDTGNFIDSRKVKYFFKTNHTYIIINLFGNWPDNFTTCIKLTVWHCQDFHTGFTFSLQLLVFGEDLNLCQFHCWLVENWQHSVDGLPTFQTLKKLNYIFLGQQKTNFCNQTAANISFTSF